MRIRFVFLAVAMLAFASAAPALTLQDLNSGAAFASGDGNLLFTFAPGSISLNGALDPDLSLYPVTALLDGFEISGPLAVFGGTFGGVTLGYEVALAGPLLTGADLLITGLATGASALASAGTTLSNGIGLGTVIAGNGLNQPTDNAPFGPEGGPLQGVTGIQLMALGVSDLALLQTVRQRFSVAEPSTTLMLMGGLSGLAFLGRRRPQRSRGSSPAGDRSRPEATAAG